MGSKSKQFNMKSTATYLFGRKTKKSKKGLPAAAGKTLPDIISKSFFQTSSIYV